MKLHRFPAPAAEQAEAMRKSLERRLSAVVDLPDVKGIAADAATVAHIKTTSLLLDAVDWALSGMAFASLHAGGTLRVEGEDSVDHQLFSFYRDDILIGSIEVYLEPENSPLIGSGIRCVLSRASIRPSCSEGAN